MNKRKGIGGHHNAVMKSDEWLTPPEIVNSLGEFDLDPCSPVFRPWPTAKNHFTIQDNGLIKEWFGRVWCNPPYGKIILEWMKKMSGHNNGIALTFARTETQFFHQYIFPFASSIFFFEKRLNFYTVAGTRAEDNGGAPSVLIAYGEHNSDAISDAKLNGCHLPVNSIPFIVIGVSPSWSSVVDISLTRLSGTANLEAIYDMVERLAPDKIKINQHYKAKVRQTLQLHFDRIGRGQWAKKTYKQLTLMQ